MPGGVAGAQPRMAAPYADGSLLPHSCHTGTLIFSVNWGQIPINFFEPEVRHCERSAAVYADGIYGLLHCVRNDDETVLLQFPNPLGVVPGNQLAASTKA